MPPHQDNEEEQHEQEQEEFKGDLEGGRRLLVLANDDDDNDVKNDNSNKDNSNNKDNNNKDNNKALWQSLVQAAATTVATSLTRRPYTTITKLDLPHAGLSSLPSDFAEVLIHLRILFLSHNHFETLPAVVGQCPQLQIMAFKHNKMTFIPPQALPTNTLRWLILTDNCLTELPQSTGQCTKLQKCMLSGNALTALPDTMRHCNNLELIRLASNQLQAPPMHILTLPQLKWIALADNPFHPKQQQTSSSSSSSSSPSPSLPILTHITDDMDGDILGQGAGGVTKKIIVPDNKDGNHEDGTIAVAVKTFHGGMTSDGKASSERTMAVQLAPLKLPGLVQVLGQTAQHGSLVMEYLDGYTVLAHPPSLETCTRDVYVNDENDSSATSRPIDGPPPPKKVAWTRSQAEHVVSVLLQTLLGMHQQAGICHGDFYAHNILYRLRSNDGNNDTDGGPPVDVRLVDLGAAFPYHRQDAALAAAVEHTEVRAFQTLVAEINRNCLQQSSSSIMLQSLADDGTATTLDELLVAWRKLQLADLTKAFDPDVGLEQEEKVPENMYG